MRLQKLGGDKLCHLRLVLKKVRQCSPTFLVAILALFCESYYIIALVYH